MLMSRSRSAGHVSNYESFFDTKEVRLGMIEKNGEIECSNTIESEDIWNVLEIPATKKTASNTSCYVRY